MVLPLEQAALIAVLNNVMGRLFAALGSTQAYKMLRDLEAESDSLKQDLHMLAAAVDDELTGARGAARRTAVARAYSREMRALTHDVDDCIERFVHRVAGAGSGLDGSSWLRRAAHRVCTLRTCYRFAAEIRRLKRRVQEASARVLKPPEGQIPGSRRRAGAADHAARHPVGIDRPMEEVLARLDLDQVEGQPRVVAVVGFGGVGKTTLARAVYHAAPVADAFPCRAWVVVRSPEDGDAAGILEKIHHQLLPGQQYSESSLTKYLKDKRYLIVIDDVDDIEEEQWDTITSAFEGNREGSRIVVTTTFRPTANRRSDANGCVYKMRTLGMTDSMTIALRGRCTAELVQGSETLLKKCGGLPLALVSVARQLSSEDEPTGQFYSELCSKLGSYLEREDGEPNFARLRDVLMDSYTSLSDLNVRTCLLYLSIFPNDRPLRKNVIIRRWLAEGYALSEDNTLSEQNVANGNFKTLIDRNIVLPVKPRKNAEIKTCKTHGIMHEFLLHRAMHEKFIMCSHAPSDQIVRHLFVNGHVCDNTKSTKTMKMDLSRVRSLTVSGNAGVAISDLGKYKLMRVLDLEECTDMNDSHVRKICKLWNLRYLSLSCNITNLPKEIAKLKLLETLVLSKTVVSALPVEVIGLPCLVNLIGKFKLLDRDSVSSFKMESLSKNEGLEDLFRKSKLETLAGFVDDGSQKQGFLQLMVHLKKLKKVKIWCESTEGVGDNNHLKAELVKAIGQYIKTPMGTGDARSLSIHFQGVRGVSLCALQELCYHSTSLEETYYLSSLKLHDNLSTYPEFIGILSGLTELCLSSAIISRNLLSVLSEMPLLLYLKLIADEIDSFVIKYGTFQSMRRLCFLVRHQNPVLPIVEEGALAELVSLQLLCKHLTGPSGIEIRHLRMLQEIELHPEVSDPLRQEWEAAALNHPNRPIVLPFITCNDPVGNELKKNPVQSPEESGHEKVVIQGQLAHETPRPYVQHMPLSTCDCSGPSSEIDDSAYHEPMESAIGTEGAAIETLIDEQLLIEEPLEHTPVETNHENSMAQSRTNGILDSTSDHLVLEGKGMIRETASNGKGMIRETASNNKTYCRGGIKI